jgi:hypothetical protein
MADAGEGLIDAQNRIQERMDEPMPQGDHDPEQLRRAESLRLAYTELSRQLEATSHTARRQQLSSALAELERQLKALGARPH